ncbi:MAG: GntR family transcriptional regulator [Verrucomicrobiaceae bacterium]|nr:GntR family transcriptional regulator [Verrucomicrobiaceae bacterium]
MPSSSTVVAEPVYKPDLVRRMLLAIFGGRWKEGERLREVELADQFGVSRTPVREALQEIARIGLIELKPNCGAVVASFGPREIEEIYEVRALLESEATRLACPRLRVDDVKSLLEDSKALLAASRRNKEWTHRAWEADHRLHEMLALACGNRRLAREVGDYANFVQIIRETLGNRDRVQDHAIAEHIAILEALHAGKADEAGKAMRRHVLSAGKTAVEALRPNFSAPSPGGRTSSLAITSIAARR